MNSVWYDQSLKVIDTCTEGTIENVVSDVGIELSKKHSCLLEQLSIAYRKHQSRQVQCGTFYFSFKCLVLFIFPPPRIVHLMVVTPLRKLDCNTVISWAPVRRLVTNSLQNIIFRQNMHMSYLQ